MSFYFKSPTDAPTAKMAPPAPLLVWPPLSLSFSRPARPKGHTLPLSPPSSGAERVAHTWGGGDIRRGSRRHRPKWRLPQRWQHVRDYHYTVYTFTWAGNRQERERDNIQTDREPHNQRRPHAERAQRCPLRWCLFLAVPSLTVTHPHSPERVARPCSPLSVSAACL